MAHSSRTSTRQALTDIYLTIDARSLGLVRIGLGLLLLVDLARRLPHIRDFYTNVGVLPNHTVLWRPQFTRLFSLMFSLSLGGEVVLTFIICAFCYLCLLIGWRTRLSHILSFALVTSLHNRIVMAENSGAMSLGVLMVWTLFMPLGRRFSVDAVLASLRARPGETSADLTPDRLPPPDDRPLVSLAAVAFLLQLAVIYWFNFVQKSGETWHQGTALHYILWQERIVTQLGFWAREHLPFALWKLLTHMTLVVEATAPFLILSPVGRHWTRAVAALTLIGFHVSIAVLVNVGIFSGAMIAFYPLLLTEAHWRLLGRLVGEPGRARVVIYDAGCGVCFAIVRVLARMDVHRRLTWISNSDRSPVLAKVPADLLERTILVVDPATGRCWTRSDAFAQIFAALPLGRLWACPLLAPGVRTLAGWAYAGFARNRTAISTWLGLAARGIPRAPAPPVPEGRRETPLAIWWHGALSTLRELGVGFVLFVFAADLSVSNAAFPQGLRWSSRPEWMVAAVTYPHIFQNWSMFAPDAPMGDYNVVVDAVTRGGRRVDPLNEVASRVANLPLEDIPQRLEQDSFWCDYILRIPNMPAYHQAFLEWILRYPERTGHPDDAITSLEASTLEHASPPPGQIETSHIRRRVFLQWPSPSMPRPQLTPPTAH